jgi:hypothetical protein
MLGRPGLGSLQLAPVEDQQTIEALAANGSDETLGERVRPRRPDGGLDDPHTVGAEHLVEAGGELGVSIPDEELGRTGSLGEGALRACWTTHSPTGVAVMPLRCTRRVSISIKNRT